MISRRNFYTWNCRFLIAKGSKIHFFLPGEVDRKVRGMKSLFPKRIDNSPPSPFPAVKSFVVMMPVRAGGSKT